jgi:hypothetical protein
VKVVMSADELAKEDEKKRVKRANAGRNGSISATELCQIVPSTVLLPILSLLSHVESITYVLSIRAMRATLSLWSVILPM